MLATQLPQFQDVASMGDLNTVMKNMFQTLPFYPTSSYLKTSQSSILTQWTPTPPIPPLLSMLQEEEGQGEGNNSILESFRQSNQEIESFLNSFGDPNQELFILEMTLHKNFNEPFSSIIIVYSPGKMKTFTLMVKNATSKLVAIVILSPQMPPNDKEK